MGQKKIEQVQYIPPGLFLGQIQIMKLSDVPSGNLLRSY